MALEPDIIRPLNLSEQNIYRMSKQGTMWVLQFVEAQGPFTTKLVSAALQLLQQEHPLLSACMIKDQNDVWYWKKTSEPVTLEEEVSILLPESSRDYLLDAYVPNEGLIIMPNTRPMWRVKWIKSDQGDRHMFIFHLNHALCDGQSLMYITNQFIQHCDKLSRSEKVEVKSYVPANYFEIAENVMGWRASLFHLQKGILSKFQGIFPMPRFSSNKLMIASEDEHLAYDFSSRRMHFLPIAFTREETKEIVAASKKHGVTVHCALTAAAHLALNAHSKLFPPAEASPPTFHTYQSSLRQDPEANIPKNHVITAIGLHFASLPPAEASTVDELLENTEQFWSIASLHATKNLSSAKENLLRNGYRTMTAFSYVTVRPRLEDIPFGRRPNYNISNRGSFEIPLAGKFSVDRVWQGSTEHISGPQFGMNMTTVNGQLCWTIVYFTPYTTTQRTCILRDNIVKLLMRSCEEEKK